MKLVSKTIYLFYAKGKSNIFSGQRIATEILAKGLSGHNWNVVEVCSPALDRLNSAGEASKPRSITAISQLVLKLFSLWFIGFSVSLTRSLIYVNPGQSIYGLFRDGFPLLIRGILNYQGRGIVSLHGSIFCQWELDSLEANLLKTIIRGSKYVTVLGSHQRHKLEEFGVPHDKIIQLDNTCITEKILENDIFYKHQDVDGKLFNNSENSLKVLYLGYLLEAKGYIQFLEAIETLSRSDDLRLEITLCGQLRTDSEQTPRFNNNLLEARRWIENLISRVNQSQYVSLRWIEGAAGDEKARLFKEAHIFILPTQFRVEAQPISILEALAYGCVVITSKVGEIPHMFSEDTTAILLDDCSSVSISKAIKLLSEDNQIRTQMALDGFNLFKQRYSFDKHTDSWINLLESICE
jgi:hypothetical protein